MSTTPAAETTPLPTEMSDRFGPMLVKELRQGLRTKIFLTAFIGFQAVLLIMVLAGFAAHTNSSSGDFLNMAIWSVLMVMLVVITPLRGQFALEKEIRMGTLELLQITNLDAWRIVRGKWAALMGEAMLYLTAALPYFTLRYFLGGVHILSDLGLLALTALFSASLTAIVVGLSGFRSVLLRIGVAIAIVALVPMSISIAGELRSPYGPFSIFGSTPFSEWWGLLAGFLLTLCIVGWSFLRLGARTIATQAENHSSSVRVWTCLGLVALLLLDHTAFAKGSRMDEGSMYLLFVFALALYTCGIFCAITDNSLQSTRVYAPFIRRRMTPLGVALLYPGWGSGFFYVLAMSILMLFVRLMTEEFEVVMISTLVIYNFLMQPAAVTRIMMNQRKMRLFNLSTYITILVSLAIASSVLLIAELAVTDGEPAITLLLPIPGLIGVYEDEMLAIGMQALSAVVVTFVLMIAAIDDLRFIKARQLATREILAQRDLAAVKQEEEKPEEPEAKT